MHIKNIAMLNLFLSFVMLWSCSEDEPRRGVDPPEDSTDVDSVIVDNFYFGADLSYVNQILDHGGQYLDGGQVKDPYEIFADRGTNLARFRLWHNPVWTKEVYGDAGTQLYNDLYDVEESIKRSREAGMKVLLDFHYSDNWADPGTQRVPDAWKNITDIGVLADSVYDYTYQVLSYLKSKDLMPEMVQVGNETNCGMMRRGGSGDFPNLDVCEGNWKNFGQVVNSAIRAIREVDATTQVILHVANPTTADWWFEDLMSTGGVTDFEMIGLSYYPLWHDEVPLHQLKDRLAGYIAKYNREVIILETAYPWTVDGADNYNNIFGGQNPISGYPFTQEGQFDFLTTLTQNLIDAGASGVVYWEPAWITSDMKDQWGTGSSWENNTFFDFEGNTLSNIDYMNFEYDTHE